jgi:hypothetical protein
MKEGTAVTRNSQIGVIQVVEHFPSKLVHPHKSGRNYLLPKLVTAIE